MDNPSENQEEFKISGENLMQKVKDLIQEGNARRIIIKNESGATVLEVPLSIGVIGAVIAPTLAAIGAATALLTKCTVVVIRDPNSTTPH